MSISHYTEATGDWKPNTDLGIVIPNLNPPINTNPAKGAIKSVSLGREAGEEFGYTAGNILCNSTGGTGGGATFNIEATQIAGVLIPRQKMSLTPSGSAKTGTDGTTGAIVSTSQNGSGATFQLVAKGGVIQYAIVVSPGSGYTQGESIKISKTSIIEDGVLGNKISSGVQIYVSGNDITASISKVNGLANGGSRYTVGDVLTLTDSITGTGSGQVTITALDMGTLVVIQKKYPIGLYISKYLGGEGVTGGTIELVLLDDSMVNFDNLIQGTILPIAFKQILTNPEKPAPGEVTEAVLFYE